MRERKGLLEKEIIREQEEKGRECEKNIKREGKLYFSHDSFKKRKVD